MKKPENSILFESYHVLKDQVLIMQQFQMIRENCFFCEDFKHMINSCDKLKPKF